jgi:hypothetical protein
MNDPLELLAKTSLFESVAPADLEQLRPAHRAGDGVSSGHQSCSKIDSSPSTSPAPAIANTTSAPSSPARPIFMYLRQAEALLSA